MKKLLTIIGITLLVATIILCVILNAVDGVSLLQTYVESVADTSAAARFAAEAQYEENLERRLQIEALKAPVDATAFAVRIQTWLLVFWNFLMPLSIFLYVIGKFLQPLFVTIRDKVKYKYASPTIEMQDDTSL